MAVQSISDFIRDPKVDPQPGDFLVNAALDVSKRVTRTIARQVIARNRIQIVIEEFRTSWNIHEKSHNWNHSQYRILSLGQWQQWARHTTTDKTFGLKQYAPQK